MAAAAVSGVSATIRQIDNTYSILVNPNPNPELDHPVFEGRFFNSKLLTSFRLDENGQYMPIPYKIEADGTPLFSPVKLDGNGYFVPGPKDRVKENREIGELADLISHVEDFAKMGIGRFGSWLEKAFPHKNVHVANKKGWRTVDMPSHQVGGTLFSKEALRVLVTDPESGHSKMHFVSIRDVPAAAEGSKSVSSKEFFVETEAHFGNIDDLVKSLVFAPMDQEFKGFKRLSKEEPVRFELADEFFNSQGNLEVHPLCIVEDRQRFVRMCYGSTFLEVDQDLLIRRGTSLPSGYHLIRGAKPTVFVGFDAALAAGSEKADSAAEASITETYNRWFKTNSSLGISGGAPPKPRTAEERDADYPNPFANNATLAICEGIGSVFAQCCAEEFERALAAKEEPNIPTYWEGSLSYADYANSVDFMVARAAQNKWDQYRAQRQAAGLPVPAKKWIAFSVAGKESLLRDGRCWIGGDNTGLQIVVWEGFRNLANYNKEEFISQADVFIVGAGGPTVAALLAMNKMLGKDVLGLGWTNPVSNKSGASNSVVKEFTAHYETWAPRFAAQGKHVVSFEEASQLQVLCPGELHADGSRKATDKAVIKLSNLALPIAEQPEFEGIKRSQFMRDGVSVEVADQRIKEFTEHNIYPWMRRAFVKV